MKIIVINGSPRKKWNTARLLESFAKGMCSVGKDVEVKQIHLYDYKYTGCRSCFACKLANNIEDGCRIHDDIYEILAECRKADALVIGSPVYFCDLSAQLKAFLERLMYPGKTAKVIPTYFILSMNAPEDAFKEVIQPQIPGMGLNIIIPNTINNRSQIHQKDAAAILILQIAKHDAKGRPASALHIFVPKPSGSIPVAMPSSTHSFKNDGSDHVWNSGYH